MSIKTEDVLGGGATAAITVTLEQTVKSFARSANFDKQGSWH